MKYGLHVLTPLERVLHEWLLLEEMERQAWFAVVFVFGNDTLVVLQ